jgi:hypothetical protein
MPHRLVPHSRIAAATLRRIVALALPRTHQYAPQAIAAPGLAAAVPDERATYRPGV